ncbi:MAG: polysaccharide biosynthesis/export family protein [Glaciimonas sp.]|nr:polysaccharide biosynthesis/export family protein [Glaciimonas sp.]
MDNDEASTKGADASMLKVITPQLLQNEQLMREQQVDADISPLMHAATPYHIGNGDILSIIVWDHPELATPMMVGATQITTSGTDSGATPGFVVDQNGMVQFPYVGLLKLAGLTEAEARDVLMQKIGRYLKKPNLTLRVQAYRSQRVYISGEVKSQGSIR